jgi:hypothetical protein
MTSEIQTQSSSLEYGLSHYEKRFKVARSSQHGVLKPIRGGEGIPTWALIRNDPNGRESSRCERRECRLIPGGPEWLFIR